jgi:hypothetical protein
MKLVSLYLATASLAALTACNKTPVQFSYAQNPASYCTGSAITPNKATATGSVAGYSVSPSLPAGLSLNPTDGTISGTPTTASPTMNYAVSALSDVKAVASVTLSLAVGGKISYASPLVYHQDSAASTFVSNSGATFTDCAITPALPAGLTLNKATCAISGTPTAASPAMDYKVSATGPCSTDGAVVSITVMPSSVAAKGPRVRPSRMRRAMAPKNAASRFSK